MHDFVHKNNARPKYKEILFLTVTAIRTDSRDEGDEGEDEDENEDDDPLPAGNLLSGGIGGDQGARGGDFKVSTGPAPCLFLAKARATSASTASFRDKGGP